MTITPEEIAAATPNLSADGYSTAAGWSSVIREHPPGGGDGVIVWEKHGMKSEWHAETAMEAAWQRLMRRAKEPS